MFHIWLIVPNAFCSKSVECLPKYLGIVKEVKPISISQILAVYSILEGNNMSHTCTGLLNINVQPLSISKWKLLLKILIVES